MSDYTEILDFWFQGTGLESGAAIQRWFNGGKAVDQAIEQGFSNDVAIALDGGHTAWAGSAKGRLALILLLDQFTRNIYRGSATAFAGDNRAVNLCQEGIDTGMEPTLAPFERAFFLMPLEHSECLSNQNRSVTQFEALANNVPAQLRKSMQSFAGYARQHRDIIQRFGRFPHRNEALQRQSTRAELAFLEQGPRYGQ